MAHKIQLNCPRHRLCANWSVCILVQSNFRSAKPRNRVIVTDDYGDDDDSNHEDNGDGVDDEDDDDNDDDDDHDAI